MFRFYILFLLGFMSGIAAGTGSRFMNGKMLGPTKAPEVFLAFTSQPVGCREPPLMTSTVPFRCFEECICSNQWHSPAAAADGGFPPSHLLGIP